jgi:zinc transport system permease protein
MSFPFVRYALIVGVLIALSSSLLGVTLVLKRYSYIGDGLSHVAFGTVSVATILGISSEMIVVMPVTIVTAVLLLRTSKSRRIHGDAAIGMISVGSLAIGYLLLNVFSNSANITGDVCSTLFGSTSILTLTLTDVWICVVMSLVVLVIYFLFYHKIFAITFDEDFAKATGVKADAYNTLLSIVTAIIIVLAMNLVGSLLISALVIFPAVSAMGLFKNFKMVVLASGIISVICGVFGLLASILYSTPVGSTIVVANIVVFVITRLITFLKERK